MIVINLIGGPNTGKSVTALGLTYNLKKMGMKAEYVSEYAKDMVYECRNNILDDQLYLLAKQNRRLARLDGIVDYVVTDSSLLAGLVYNDNTSSNELINMVKQCYNNYINKVFYFQRNYSFAFDNSARVQQSHEEASEMDDKFLKILPKDSYILSISDDYVESILNILGFKK